MILINENIIYISLFIYIIDLCNFLNECNISFFKYPIIIFCDTLQALLTSNSQEQKNNVHHLEVIIELSFTYFSSIHYLLEYCSCYSNASTIHEVTP